MEVRTVTATEVERYSDTGAELGAAREADAAWRAAKRARFAASLKRLQRGTRPVEIGLSALALGVCASGIRLVLSSIDAKAEADRVRVDADTLAAFYCLLAFLALMVAVLSVGKVSGWLRHLILARAAVEAVDLNEPDAP